MATKKRPAKKRRRAQKVIDRVKIAKRAMPNWLIADKASVNTSTVPVDAATPQLSQLKKKYQGRMAKTDRTDSNAATSNKLLADDESGGLVVMRPASPEDSRGKPLSVFVDKGKVTGKQG